MTTRPDFTLLHQHQKNRMTQTTALLFHSCASKTEITI